jgi:superfamily II DNA or RNA helicase
MPDIVASLKDYSMLKVQCERGIAQELSEYFSFFVPGYKFMPAFKAKVWDGKIRLFNTMNGELSAGLYVYMIKFCAERGYEMDTEETDYGLPALLDKVDPEFLKEFYKQLKLPYELREYQHDAVTVGLQRRNAILLSPTGSGKSLIIYCLMRHILGTEKNKILIIVPTTSLVEQLHKDFADYGYDADNKVHKIYSGKEKVTNKRIIISTWQSIYKFPKKWFEQFDAVFGDECHGFKSKSLSSIMNKATEAKYRFGTTGTLDGTLTHKLVLEGLFGPVYQVTATKKLQDDGTLAQLNITVLMLKYLEETREANKDNDYQKEIDFLIKHEKRNKLIKNMALNQKGNTLVLYLRVDGHGKPLFNMIKDTAAEDRKVFFVSGDVAAEDREAIRRIVETQKDAIIVASLGTFSTGINIRNLHNIIFASPSKSQIKVLQSIGRGLRQSDDGSTTQLFDIADDLHYKAKKNFTLLHSAERVKIYSKEQFNYKIVQVEIE